MPENIVRVLRLIEYEGPRTLVEKQISKSLHGTREGICDGLEYVRIAAVTLDQFPQVLEEARKIPVPEALEQGLARIAQLSAEVKRLEAKIQESRDMIES